MEEIVNYLYDNLVGENSVPERLRLKLEVSTSELDKLIEMTKKAVEYYKGEDYIPKKLAACFVDIYNNFSFRKDFYSEPYLDLYEDVGLKLQELAYELFDE